MERNLKNKKQNTNMKKRLVCENKVFYTKINKCRNINKSIISLYLYNGGTLL